MTNTKNILCWSLFLPISLLCGLLVFLVFDTFVGRYIGPDSTASYLNHIAAGGLSGAATVYIGVYIAPSYEKKVAIGYAVITLIGFILTLIFVKQEYGPLDNLTYVAQNVGVLYMAWRIYQDKVVFEKQ